MKLTKVKQKDRWLIRFIFMPYVNEFMMSVSAQLFIEAGAAGIHLEDQKPGTKVWNTISVPSLE